MVKDPLESATASNFAIQQVQQLEMELQTQHEHLNTPCWLLSTLVMVPDSIKQVAAIVRNHVLSKCGKKEIIMFLGDFIECYFRNRTDEGNRRDTIMQKFCIKHQMNSTGSAEVRHFLLDWKVS